MALVLVLVPCFTGLRVVSLYLSTLGDPKSTKRPQCHWFGHDLPWFEGLRMLES